MSVRNVLTKDGQLQQRVINIIRNFEERGMDVKAVLEQKKDELQTAILFVQLFSDPKVKTSDAISNREACLCLSGHCTIEDMQAKARGIQDILDRIGTI